ncbi:MAG: type IV pilin N-terminal domain-containing protein, partial [Candidatus Methanoperedenaceae archaeon]|nr:type IV pilin N-terminal domain-containing protein [Candidatus Methanoperedenaceae archaeon]
MKKLNRDESAVSPVIGVMLMIVVTVILAASVSSYSSGILTVSEPAPSATFKVSLAKDMESGMPEVTVSYLVIEQVSGDSISTKNLKLLTEWKGNITEVLPNSMNTNYSYSYIYNGTTYTVYKSGTSPYLGDPSKGYFGNNPRVDFGNYTIQPGAVMRADEYSNYVGTTG